MTFNFLYAVLDVVALTMPLPCPAVDESIRDQLPWTPISLIATYEYSGERMITYRAGNLPEWAYNWKPETREYYIKPNGTVLELEI